MRFSLVIIGMVSFDESPMLYWALGYFLLFGWVFFTCIGKPKQQNAVFLTIASFMILMMRLPVIFHNKGLNQDESQMLAQALTLRQNPVLFESVDTTTGGPLSSYLLAFVNIFGLSLDFFTAHLLATALVIGSIILLYKASEKLFGSTASVLAIIPIIVFEALTQETDFVHYSSELMPLLIISLMLYSYAKNTNSSIFFLGFLSVLTIFGKLQALPIAGIIAIYALAETIFNKQFKKSLLLIGGGILGLGLFSLLFWSWGVFDDVIDYYFIRNITAHTAERPLYVSILHFPAFVAKNFDFLSIAILPLLTIVLNKNWSKKISLHGGFIISLLLVSIFSVVRTGSEYLHYLQLLIPTIVLVSSLLWSRIELNKPTALNIKLIPFVLLAIYFIGNVVYKKFTKQHINKYPTQDLTLSAVSKEILKHAKSGEKLVVWGWNCDYYVETQMPQGTQENHIPYVVLPHKMQPEERQKFMNDISRNKPKIFIDAVGKNSHWFNDKEKFKHENFRELKEYIENNYILVNFVDDVRIYKRK